MTTVSCCVGEGQAELEAVRAGLREGHLNAVRNILPDRVVADECRRLKHVFRERVLTPTVTVLHMIAAALWPDASFKAAWDVVAADAIESGSLSKARNRLPTALFQALFDYVAGVAAKAGKDPTRLGFVTAVRLVIATSLRMSAAPARELPALYALMLERIAAEDVPERPGRNEPRAKRRETKHYETLKTTRAQWRAQHAKAA